MSSNIYSLHIERSWDIWMSSTVCFVAWVGESYAWVSRLKIKIIGFLIQKHPLTNLINSLHLSEFCSFSFNCGEQLIHTPPWVSTWVNLKSATNSHRDIGGSVRPALCDEGGISLSHKPESSMCMAMSNEVQKKDRSCSPPFLEQGQKVNLNVEELSHTLLVKAPKNVVVKS